MDYQKDKKIDNIKANLKVCFEVDGFEFII